MTPKILIPGLLSDAVVWESLLPHLDGPVKVADLTSQDSINQMALDCLSLFEGKVSIAGHSMGARVAMEMARIAPERMERIALLDTGIHPLREGEREKRQEVIRFAHQNGMKGLVGQWLAGMVHEPNQQNEALMKSLTLMVERQDPDIHERQITALTNRPNASLFLSEIACPVLLLVGRDDQWSPVSQHEDMLELLPDARLEIVDDAGHFSLVEQPDEVARIVAGFLN